MKATVIEKVGDTPQYRDFDDPVPAEGELLIRVKAVALEKAWGCKTDAPPVSGGYPPRSIAVTMQCEPPGCRCNYGLRDLSRLENGNNSPLRGGSSGSVRCCVSSPLEIPPSPFHRSYEATFNNRARKQISKCIHLRCHMNSI
jgi:hypothetical protein